VARPTSGRLSPVALTGKPLYRALKLRSPADNSVSTDLESLFYSLLAFASDNKALAWRHLDNLEMMTAWKFYCMFSLQAWESRVLKHCRAELAVLICKLHTVIFGSSESEYLDKDVTVDEFVAALRSHQAA
jgi:hypothetical protein